MLNKQTISQSTSLESGNIPQIKTATPFATTSEIEFCAYIDKITAAVETGSFHEDLDFVPKLFSSADGFETFLSEMAVFYKHSVDGWNHTFSNVIAATDAIRRERTTSLL